MKDVRLPVILRGLLALLPAVLLGSRAGGQSVWVVDAGGGPGADFTEIQPAIDAAGDGDLLLVRSGAYAYATVDAKSLVLQAEAGAAVVLDGLTVSHLPADRFVSARGFTIDRQGWVFLDGNAGPVRLEDFADVPVPASLPGGVNGVVRACADTVLRSCHWRGDYYGLFDGLFVHESTVALYDCQFRGDDSRLEGFDLAGGMGLQVEASQVFVMGSHFEGGRGSRPAPFPGSLSGPGGDGTSVVADGVLDVVDCTSIGGSPGGAGQPPGMPFSASGGSRIHHRPHAARTMAVDSPLREGQTATITFEGAPGDLVVLHTALRPGLRETLTRRIGPLLLSTFESTTSVGVIPVSGALTTTFTAPAIPGATLSLFLQATFLGGRPGLRSGILHGAPTQIHVLDGGL